ncbi:protein-L-isoaspartate(D-aspartate) O-methyltransferase [Tissierella creatinini]|nr:protein-L-isoaspartate(D-aspartate) O-methyltransferase [Tissierella creatinini]TJX62818.1 protein-L-isoaspartate(D-aspartate) O-methyltransferase [Soehngenia saccharolytica]
MDYKELREYMYSLDRSLFVPYVYKKYADFDEPLPIGYGQTISQPSLVLQMTYLLSLEKDSKVLEIGTGSGFQTAILSHFSNHVYTVELLRTLSEKAKKRLKDLGYNNIDYKIGDGSEGWIEHAPYDRIIVTAGAQRVPDELIQQLDKDGIMIIPVGPQHNQELLLITKDKEGKTNIRKIEDVRFVELKGKYGWSHEDMKD